MPGLVDAATRRRSRGRPPCRTAPRPRAASCARSARARASAPGRPPGSRRGPLQARRPERGRRRRRSRRGPRGSAAARPRAGPARAGGRGRARGAVSASACAAPPRRDRRGRSTLGPFGGLARPRPLRAEARSGRSRMPFARGEPALRVERGHGTASGGGDGLAVRVVDDVAGGEDALDVGRGRARLGHQVPGLVVVELVEEQLRVRVVPDRHEEPLGGQVARLARVQVAERGPRSSARSRR